MHFTLRSYLPQCPFNFEGICYIISSDQVILSSFLFLFNSSLRSIDSCCSCSVNTPVISWFEKLVRGRWDILSLWFSFSFQQCCFYIYFFIFNADKSTQIKTDRHQLLISRQKHSTWSVVVFCASTSTHYNNDYIATITECKSFLLKK